MKGLDIAIVGAGIGGLTCAAALRKDGHEVSVYEQADGFKRLGAGIQQGPNAVKVLRQLGLEPLLRQTAFQPNSSLNRLSSTGEITWERALGKEVERKYGAPYFYMHRGDLHGALARLVPDSVIHHNCRLTSLRMAEKKTELTFSNGEQALADVVIGADGIHSVVRAQLFNDTSPRFTGRVAYRATFPAEFIDRLELDGSAKWWGTDRHIVIDYLNPRRDEVYFVTSTPEPHFKVESWSEIGDLNVLREAYAGFHPKVRAVLDACPVVHKWALVERDPMPEWGVGRVTLMGDACHPMTPYMAQGAATAMEDAAVLTRALRETGAHDVEASLRRYEKTRKTCTARIQQISALNDMEKIRAEIDRVYSYDAWTTPLAEGS